MEKELLVNPNEIAIPLSEKTLEVNVKVNPETLNEVHKEFEELAKSAPVITEENDIVKEELDIYLLDNNYKKDLSFDEKKDILFDFCKLNNRYPKETEKYKNINIGRWFIAQKTKIKTYLDDVYNSNTTR